MYTGIRNFETLIQKCFDNIKPGGWIEVSSIHLCPKSDDGTLPKDAAIVELFQTFHKYSERLGADLDFILHLKQAFKEAGFIKVSQEMFKIPTSPWAKDPIMKEIGILERSDIIDGAPAFLNKVKTSKEIDELVIRLEKELYSNKMHCWMPL
jgi:hypothetical protein